MKKALAALAAVIITVFSFAQPAQAAVYKTTVTISVPKYVAAGISVPVDVTICPIAMRTDKECLISNDRVVTLYANKKKVATVKSAGLATFAWTPATAGKYVLTATAAAVVGFKAASSASFPVTVGKKTTRTPLSMKYCDQATCDSTPMTMAFDDPAPQMSALLGKVVAMAKGRTVHAQFIDTTNHWYTFATAKTAYNNEFAQYTADFSLETASTEYCPAGDETYDWTFRVLVDGTSKYAPAANTPMTITFDCGRASSTGSPIKMSDNYGDQIIDSSVDTVPLIDVEVLDPDAIGYTLRTYYCTSDCSAGANWTLMQQDGGVSDSLFTFDPDWGLGVGTYKFVVDLTPANGLPVVSGNVYTITIF